MSVTEAQSMVALYIEAEKKVLSGQSYTIGNRSLNRSNLTEIRNGRNEWEVKLRTAQAAAQGGSSLYSVADFS
jgi:hypothetical protein